MGLKPKERGVRPVASLVGRDQRGMAGLPSLHVSLVWRITHC